MLVIVSGLLLLQHSTLSSYAYQQHVLSTGKNRRSFLLLHGMAKGRSDSNSNDNEDGSFDLEAARQRLETLVRKADSNSNSNSDKAGGKSVDLFGSDDDEDDTPSSGMLTRTIGGKPSRLLAFSLPADLEVGMPHAPPVLTTIERERREAEIRLLSKLESGDDVLSDLWTHWFQERGQEAAARLAEAESLTSMGPRGCVRAEAILRDLIKTYGVWWAEPVNRLATLYYQQGKFEESGILCKMVLSIKPWHFGALSGIVMVFAALRDSDQACQWAARRLPSYVPTGSKRRRSAWVRKAILDAHESLLEAEGRLKETFGKQDNQISLSNDSLLLENDSWQ